MSAPDPTSHADWTKSGGAQPNDSGPPVIPPLQDLVPGHVPGEFPTDEPIASHKLDVPSADSFTGAGGAAYSSAASGTGHDAQQAGNYGRPEASASPPTSPSTGQFSSTGGAYSTGFKDEGESHAGRNTAIAGGATAAAAGAAGVGVYEMSEGKDGKLHDVNNAPTQPGWIGEKHSEQQNVTGTVPTHPEGTHHSREGGALGGAATGAETHHGKDAAIAGGATAAVGAAGVGAYELSKDSKPSEVNRAPTQPGWIGEKKSEHQTVTGTVPTHSEGTHHSREGGALGGAAAGAETHHGQDAAIGGAAVAGTGAAGYGAYELSKSSKQTEVNNAPTQPGWVSEKNSEQKNVTGTVPTHSEGAHHSREDGALGGAATGAETHHGQAALAGATKDEESHKGRDAAIGGGAAAAAGAGIYEMRSARDEKAEVQAQKQAEKEQKEQQKEAEKAEKERQKEAERQQKEHEKAEKERQKEAEKAEKAEKEKQKEHEKAEKERQKEAEKREKEREKEAEKQQKEREKEEKERQKEAEKREKEERKAAEKREKEEKKEDDKHDKEKQAALYEDEKRRREEFERNEAAKQGQNDTHYGRDAAIAGGATAATGAAGYGAYEAHEAGKAPTTATTTTTHEPAGHSSHHGFGHSTHEPAHEPVGHTAAPSAPDAYERSGKGLIATDGELDNKFSTYDVGSDKNPQQTAALKEQIRQIEHEKAEMYPEKVGAVEKPSLIQKILHPNKSKEQQREYEESHSHDKELSEREAAHGSPGNAAAAGTAAGTAGTATGGTSSATGLPTGGASSGNKMGLPVGEDGLIHIQSEGAHPDAPHLVVREKPGGGIETTKE